MEYLKEVYIGVICGLGFWVKDLEFFFQDLGA